MSDFTVDQFKSALPAGIRKSVDQPLVDKMNALLADPDMQEMYRENLLSYTQIMKEGKFKLSSYIDAVKYVSQRLMGKTMKDAYGASFPDKMQDWAVRGVAPKDQASYITAYNKTKLVTLIMEQAIVPTWLLNQDHFQEAINTQVELMNGARSEMVRMQAANSILMHLKQPETQKLELSMGMEESSVISDLRQATQELVAQQKLNVQSGSMNAQEVAHSKVVYDNDSGDQV